MSRRITLEIDAAVFRELERRAARELLSVKELCEDILRRSASMSRLKRGGSSIPTKVDDKFIEYFSRAGHYKKSKGKKIKK